MIGRVRDKFFSMAEEGVPHWDEREPREIYRGVLMTASDIAAISKPWDVQRRVGTAVSLATLIIC